MRVSLPRGALRITIVFISFSAEQGKPPPDWANHDANAIVRLCPVCLQDSVVGHGLRRKQAHDEHHDWITIRRGQCSSCGITITFLPVFSPPYTHYSLIARSEALRRYFVEDCGWEDAAPALKDPDRVPDASTLRRWFHQLDSSQPPFTFLRTMMKMVDRCMRSPEGLQPDDWPLSWALVFPFLQRYWPLRI